MIALKYLMEDPELEELIFGGGSGGGKSRLGCIWEIMMSLKYPGSRWLMGREELKEIKQTTLVTFFDVCSDWKIKPGKDFVYNDQQSEINWYNGSKIILQELRYEPSDPNYEYLGSLEITGGFIDEVARIKFRAWSVVKTRIRYRLDEFGVIPKLLGTCNPTKDWPFTQFFEPWEKGKETPKKRFIQALVTDNPFAPRSYIGSLKNNKDKITYERMYKGNWYYDDDPSALFSFDAIRDLFTNKCDGESRFITGDVARKGRDRMPIGYWNGMQLKEICEIPEEIKHDTSKSAKFIIDWAEQRGVRRSNIVLDEDGVGGGVVDQIPGCKGFINNSACIQPPEAKDDPGKRLNYANLKTQCYDMFADYATKGTIGIDCTDPDLIDQITKELGQIKRRNMDKDGKIQLVDKQTIKEAIDCSPDFADMIMMRFYFELDKRPVPMIG